MADIFITLPAFQTEIRYSLFDVALDYSKHYLKHHVIIRFALRRSNRVRFLHI